VVLGDADALEQARARVGALLVEPSTIVRTWPELIPELYAFIRLDRVSDYTFQWLLIGLVLFTILNTMLMSVLEREHELAVMLAIGTPPRRVRLQLLVEAAYIAGLGTLAGLVVGGAVATFIQIRGWDLSALYGEGITISGLAMSTRIHSRVTVAILARLGVLVFVATVALAWIPIRRVRRIRIVEVLH
jgi:putative ABC transport system permease protein